MGYRLAKAMRDRGERTARVRRTGVLLWLLLLATLAALVGLQAPPAMPHHPKEEARP